MPTKTKTKKSKVPAKAIQAKPVAKKHKIKWSLVVLFAICAVLALITVLTLLCDSMIKVFTLVPRESANVVRIFDPKAVKAQVVGQSFSRDQGVKGYTLYEVNHEKIVFTKEGTNEILWQKNWPAGGPDYLDDMAIITKDRVYLARYEKNRFTEEDGAIGSLYSLNLQTGELVWPNSNVGGEFVKLFLQDEVLVVATRELIGSGRGCDEGNDESDYIEECFERLRKNTTGSDKIFAFNSMTGEQLWQVSVAGYQEVKLPDNSKFLEVIYSENKKKYYFIEDGTVPPETTMIESDNTIKKDE